MFESQNVKERMIESASEVKQWISRLIVRLRFSLSWKVKLLRINELVNI